MKLSITLPVAAMLAVVAALPAAAHEVVYNVTLSGPAEAPPNSSPGYGVGTVTFDLDLVTMRVNFTFADLVGTTTASHIHCCTANPGTGTAGVATVTPSFTGFPNGVKSGSYDHTFDMTVAGSYNAAFITANGGTVSSALNALLNGAEAGKAYLNLHTSVYGGGEIRGFLVAAPVPEPETYALMLGGLGLVGWVSRRRQRKAAVQA